METILAVVSHWDDAALVLAEAESLAGQFHTTVEVLLPVHAQLSELGKYLNFDDYESLKAEILASQSQRLEVLCGDKNWPRHVEWSNRAHATIVDLAEARGAGLIIMMASHDTRLSTLAHTPDDWHLFRDAPCPVLSMVRERRSCARIVAAVDAMDTQEAHQQLSRRVLDQATALAKARSVPLVVMSVVPDPALLYAGLVNAPMSGDFLSEIQARAETNLRDMLDKIGLQAAAVEVKVGQVEEVLTTEMTGGGVLVIGSAANKGIKGLLLGNTAERILRRMESDMLVVTPGLA